MLAPGGRVRVVFEQHRQPEPGAQLCADRRVAPRQMGRELDGGPVTTDEAGDGESHRGDVVAGGQFFDGAVHAKFKAVRRAWRRGLEIVEYLPVLVHDGGAQIGTPHIDTDGEHAHLLHLLKATIAYCRAGHRPGLIRHGHGLDDGTVPAQIARCRTLIAGGAGTGRA